MRVGASAPINSPRWSGNSNLGEGGHDRWHAFTPFNGLQGKTSCKRLPPCLWFDHNAEEAVNHYLSIFKNSRIVGVTRYGKAGQEIHGDRRDPS